MSEVMKVRATKMAFEKRYTNDSGVYSAVRLDGCDIEFDHCASVRFPLEELEWLIAALTRIWLETSADRAAINKATQEPEP